MYGPFGGGAFLMSEATLKYLHVYCEHAWACARRDLLGGPVPYKGTSYERGTLVLFL